MYWFEDAWEKPQLNDVLDDYWCSGTSCAKQPFLLLGQFIPPMPSSPAVQENVYFMSKDEKEEKDLQICINFQMITSLEQ